MRLRILSLILSGSAALVLAALVILPGNGLSAGRSAGSIVGSTNECQHIGGGHWTMVWNNATGAGSTHVWQNESGFYWAIYDNTTGAVGAVGWGSTWDEPLATNGTSVVNMTGESSTAESMMCSVSTDPGPVIPWHYDFVTHLFVRDT
jgi:hypothetical protein